MAVKVSRLIEILTLIVISIFRSSMCNLKVQYTH